MEALELTRIEPKKGSIPGSVCTAIRYSIHLISHPNLVESFGKKALMEGVFVNDIAILSEGKLKSGEFISSVVATDFDNDRKEVIVTIGGTYSIEPDFKLFLRIARWKYNFSSDEALTREDFRETYGQAFGDHFYEKWVSERDIEPMINYFCNHIENGQAFIGMVMKRVCQYEKRLKERK